MNNKPVIVVLNPREAEIISRILEHALGGTSYSDEEIWSVMNKVSEARYGK